MILSSQIIFYSRCHTTRRLGWAGDSQVWASLRGNQGAGRMRIHKWGARRMGKIYTGAGRLNPIWEQGAGKWQKLEGSRKKGKKGAGRIVKIKNGAGRQDPPLERLKSPFGMTVTKILQILVSVFRPKYQNFIFKIWLVNYYLWQIVHGKCAYFLKFSRNVTWFPMNDFCVHHEKVPFAKFQNMPINRLP